MNARYISSNSCSSLGFLWLYSCRIWDRGPSWKDSGSSQINSKCYWMQIQYILVIAIVLQELQTYNLIWTFRDFFSKSNSDNIALYTKKLTKPQKLKLHMYLVFPTTLTTGVLWSLPRHKNNHTGWKKCQQLITTQISLCCSAATELLQLQWRTWAAVV